MNTKIQILLGQVHAHQHPTVRVSVDDHTQNLTIDCDTWVTFDLNLPKDKQLTLAVEYYGKTIQDCIPEKNLDTAILIKDIRLNGISNEKFIWNGIYRPVYPDYYEPKTAELYNITYLGFNGVWSLELTVPLYAWMHKTLGFGWTY